METIKLCSKRDACWFQFITITNNVKLFLHIAFILIDKARYFKQTAYNTKGIISRKLYWHIQFRNQHYQQYTENFWLFYKILNAICMWLLSICQIPRYYISSQCHRQLQRYSMFHCNFSLIIRALITKRKIQQIDLCNVDLNELAFANWLVRNNYQPKNDDSALSQVFKEMNNGWSGSQSVSQSDRLFAITLIRVSRCITLEDKYITTLIAWSYHDELLSINSWLKHFPKTKSHCLPIGSRKSQ